MLERSIGVTPCGSGADAEAPTAVIVPFSLKVTTWSESILPDRTSSSFPQRTAPGPASSAGANVKISRQMRSENFMRLL
jgi:hypothetical protein